MAAASPRNVVQALDDARRELSALDRRRRSLDASATGDGRPEHERLTAMLEVAHAHMVGRDVAERALLAVVEAPCPADADVAEARQLMSVVLGEYTWHRTGLERAVREVQAREECARLEREVRRAGSLPAARPPVSALSPPTVRRSARR